jgi:small subunit ribosomal protein S15
MTLSVEQKQGVVQQHARGKNDTGSPEVQVALLSARIADISSSTPRIIIRAAACSSW